MEGSAGHEVFESLNLKPQIFINEVLNIVDDILEGAFDLFSQEAPSLLKIDQTDGSVDLKKGVDHARNKVEAKLDSRLDMWEKYCLRQCFSVPEGFSISSKNEPTCEFVDDHDDQQLDEQLELLRSKLTRVGSESADLIRQIQKLERLSALNSYYTNGSKEALQLYEQSSCHLMFEEIMRTGTELQARMDKQKLKLVEDNELQARRRVDDANTDLFGFEFSKGQSDLKLVELDDFMK